MYGWLLLYGILATIPVRFLLALLFPVALLAQIQTGDYSISGVVLNSHTGEPIKNAAVTLVQFPLQQHNIAGPIQPRFSPGIKSVLCGVGGEFLFTGLAEGRYSLRPEKPGFTEVRDPAEAVAANLGLRELKASISDVRLKLAPLGIIEGQILDQDGDPVRNVNVVAVRLKVEDGDRTTQEDRSVSTNDQGKYRLWNLEPGKYFIKAAGHSGGTYAYVGDSANVVDTWDAFAPIYAGGARDLDSANPIVIGPGDQARADLNIVREPAVKIHGTLSNFVPHETVKFELLRGKEEVSVSRSALNATTGAFEILNATPGTYTLRASQGDRTRGETGITVNEGEVNSVALSLSPAVPVRVIVHSLGKAPEGDEARMRAFCTVLLQNAERAQHILRPSDEGDEQSRFANVLPGDYGLRVVCQSGYPVAVVSGNLDLLNNPKLTIAPGVMPAPIEITVKPGGGSLTGKLVVSPMPKNSAVLLVPTFAASTGPMLSPLFSAPGSDEGAQFAFGSLAPGDYTIYAFSQGEDLEFRNPAFLQSLSGGTSVHIDEDGTKEVTVSSLVK